jgi:hypothetical protein
LLWSHTGLFVMHPSPSHRLHVAFLLLMVLLARVPDLFYHYQDWDEAAMMSQAWAMTRGEVLYRDTFQIHPILNFAIFYPFFALLPADAAAHAVKFFNLLLVAGVALAVYALGRRRGGDPLSSLLAGTLAAHYLGRRWGLSSYGEFYLLLPILASVWLLFFRPRTRAALMGVGALWGLAFFIKQVALFDAAGLTLGYFLFDRDRPEAKARSAAWIALGATLASVAVSMWLESHGIFSRAMRETLFGPAGHYAQPAVAPGGPLHRSLALALRAATGLGQAFRVLPIPFLAVGLAFPILGGMRRRGFQFSWLGAGDAERGSSQLLGVLAIWLAVDLFGVLSVATFYPHYLVQMLPPLCLLAAAPIALLRRPFKTAVAGIALSVLFAGTGFVFAKTMIQDRGEPSRVRESREVAALVRRLSGPEDRIFLYRFRGLDVFHLAGRLSSNGIYMFIDMFPEHIKDPQVASSRQRMLLERLPRLIVTDPGGLLLGCDSAEPFFRRLLSERYCLRELRGPIEIHELCDPALP